MYAASVKENAFVQGMHGSYKWSFNKNPFVNNLTGVVNCCVRFFTEIFKFHQSVTVFEI